jgi:hypothetical protein
LTARADVFYVMAQAGHAEPRMTLGIYAKVIASKSDHGAALDGLVGAAEWPATGSDSVNADASGVGKTAQKRFRLNG